MSKRWVLSCNLQAAFILNQSNIKLFLKIQTFLSLQINGLDAMSSAVVHPNFTSDCRRFDSESGALGIFPSSPEVISKKLSASKDESTVVEIYHHPFKLKILARMQLFQKFCPLQNGGSIGAQT